MTFNYNNLSENDKTAVKEYFKFLIQDGDVWKDDEEGEVEDDEEGEVVEEEDEDREQEGDKNEWKFYPNLTKIYELLLHKQKDEEKIDDIWRFLNMYRFDEEYLLQGLLEGFGEWYDDTYHRSAPFNLTIAWMMNYIQSEKWMTHCP